VVNQTQPVTSSLSTTSNDLTIHFFATSYGDFDVEFTIEVKSMLFVFIYLYHTQTMYFSNLIVDMYAVEKVLEL